jgi:hypothetical protein
VSFAQLSAASRLAVALILSALIWILLWGVL